MAPIATYVFTEVSAYGPPGDDPNITSISMAAVDSVILRNVSEWNRQGRGVRCISPPVRALTLEYSDFNFMYDMTFIETLDKPICLIAYAGFKYDFKLLKQEQRDGLLSLPGGILCADSMAAFYDILEPENGKSTQAERLAGADPWLPFQFGRNSYYALDRVYEREMGINNVSSLCCGSACNTAVLRIATKLSNDFPDWVDSNHSSFADVPVVHLR